ncbi:MULTISPECIES: hypothetical protein [Burkholderia]|uniref:HNH nuclease domain-containing protein n=1 Tax=Burkholderia sola TaxID=2843302 RepID=A0ABV2CF01_9BURK|nr:hypothetical protein [Burkholderia sp. CpTa8-5]MBP0609742.1 hypothetical protein [Burkholderia sp. CpTa8-5]
MRYIRQDDLLALIPDSWYAETEAALEELKKLSPDERGKFFADNALWSKLKEHLCKLSSDKCWYSEKRISPSELEIDHFRPKSRVTGVAPPHRGYWWLGFEWKNFRLAYSLINKRRRDVRQGDVQGKGCYFPLLDEKARVPDVAPADISREEPELIDPCRAADVWLLSYAVEAGKIVSKYTVETNKRNHQRAECSIVLFHLNEGSLIRDRKDIQVALKNLSDRADKLFTRQAENGDLSDEDQQELSSCVELITQKITSSAPFSAFARACIYQLGDRGWNTELLTMA